VDSFWRSFLEIPLHAGINTDGYTNAAKAQKKLPGIAP
jgi:hypothetical protein